MEDLSKNIKGQRRTGSACLDICMLAQRRAVAYVDYRDELSSENFLGPFAIIREVGCVLTDVKGKDIGNKVFSNLSQRHSIICAADKNILKEIVSIIA